jgi:hypothetical protein
MPRPPLLRSASCLVISACLVLLTACEATIPSGASYVVAVPTAGVYKYGPAQSFGPDFTLAQDTRVTIVQHAMGFSRVSTGNGITGYISNDDIKPAPPEPTSAQEIAASKRRLSPVFAPRLKRGDLQPTPGSPLFENGELPPLPDKAEPKPSPSFRF